MSHATSGWSVVQIWLCLAAGRSDAALRRVERLRARVPGHPWALATHAYLLAQAGRRAEAIELLRQLTLVLEQATPCRRAVAWFNLGYLLEAEGREGLEGNLCRGTGYHNIIKAVQQGAGAMSGGQS